MQPDDNAPAIVDYITIADVIHAMSENRPYHPARSTEQIIEFLIAESGKHFHPRLVQLAVELLQNDQAFRALLCAPPAIAEKL
jgi:HD-GYP domain-containing protein (c-di-GMP phosphodiesterase class II)